MDSHLLHCGSPCSVTNRHEKQLPSVRQITNEPEILLVRHCSCFSLFGKAAMMGEPSVKMKIKLCVPFQMVAGLMMYVTPKRSCSGHTPNFGYYWTAASWCGDRMVCWCRDLQQFVCVIKWESWVTWNCFTQAVQALHRQTSQQPQQQQQQRARTRANN